jgi:hypothetical protein
VQWEGLLQIQRDQVTVLNEIKHLVGLRPARRDGELGPS